MDAKTTAWRYLQGLRETVLWKVEGLSERDQRMPLTPTGTNLLGVVKHLAGVEAEYFGACLGRPWPEPMAFWADDAEPNADMWATADESPAEVLDLYRRVTSFADSRIEPLPLDAPATVPWWRTPDTDLHTLLVHMAAPTSPTSTSPGGTTTSRRCATSPSVHRAAGQEPKAEPTRHDTG